MDVVAADQDARRSGEPPRRIQQTRPVGGGVRALPGEALAARAMGNADARSIANR